MSPRSVTTKKILVFCEYYLPSVKSGGGMWTVANLVERFSDRYEFYIVTRNYDSPGDTEPFKSVKTGDWNDLGNCRVYYASAEDLSVSTCGRIVAEIDPDLVFLNSVFATAAIKFLMARRKRLAGKAPVVIAPCGELSKGALASKAYKKKIFLAFAKLKKLYGNVIWKASTDAEVIEIRNIFGPGVSPMVAPDLTPKIILPDFAVDQKPRKVAGSVRFIFLSRIVPKKNLLYFLRMLAKCESGEIFVDIVGPHEDEAYWNECRNAINDLPLNIKTNIVGSVSYPEGLDRLCNSHFFVLPTLNENFGYVFVESLAAGCPILISDQTVWGEVASKKAGWVIPLKNEEEWVRTLNACVEMDQGEFDQMASSARTYAQQWLSDTSTEEATAKVLKVGLLSSSKNN